MITDMIAGLALHVRAASPAADAALSGQADDALVVVSIDENGAAVAVATIETRSDAFTAKNAAEALQGHAITLKLAP